MDYPYDLGLYARPVTTASADAQIWFDRGLNWCFGFHHEEALRLAAAAGLPTSDAEREAAARFLRLAAEKTEPLDTGRAIEYQEHALGYLSHDPAERGRMLTRLCRMRFAAGRLEQAVAAVIGVGSRVVV